MLWPLVWDVEMGLLQVLALFQTAAAAAVVTPGISPQNRRLNTEPRRSSFPHPLLASLQPDPEFRSSGNAITALRCPQRPSHPCFGCIFSRRTHKHEVLHIYSNLLFRERTDWDWDGERPTLTVFDVQCAVLR